MPNSRTGGHSCGLVTDPVRGPEIVVAGGTYYEAYLDDVDIYTVDTDIWREGTHNKDQIHHGLRSCRLAIEGLCLYPIITVLLMKCQHFNAL